MLLNLNPNGKGDLSLANPNAMRTALNAISNGTQKLRHGAICVLGDARVGKTSLVRSLMGKNFLSETEKTEGVDSTLVETRNADEKWNELRETDLPNFQRVVNKSVAECLSTSANGSPFRVVLNFLYAITSTDMLLSRSENFIKKLGVQSLLWQRVLQFHFLIALLWVTVSKLRLLGLGLLLEVIEFLMLREIKSVGFLRWNLLAVCFGINCLRAGHNAVSLLFDKQMLECSFALAISDVILTIPEVAKEVIVFLILYALFSALVLPVQPSEIPFHSLHDTYLRSGFVPTYAHIALRAVFMGVTIGWGLEQGGPTIFEHRRQIIDIASYTSIFFFIVISMSANWRVLYFFRQLFGFSQRNQSESYDFAFLGSVTTVTLEVFMLLFCYFLNIDVVFLFALIIICELTLGVTLRYIIRLKDGEGQKTFTTGCPSQYRSSGRTGLPTHQFILQRYVGTSFFRQAQTLLENRQKLKEEEETISSLKFLIQDFAGDQEYYSYHHLFILDQAICLIVFRLTDIQSGVALITKRLFFWLGSIRAHSSSKQPCLFLVGTHRAQVDEKELKKLNSHLQSMLLPQFGDVIETDGDCMFFAVENLHSANDPGVSSLRKRIVVVAMNEVASQVEDDVPLRWLEVSQAILGLRQAMSKKLGRCDHDLNSSHQVNGNYDSHFQSSTPKPVFLPSLCVLTNYFKNFLETKKLDLKDEEDFESMLRYFHRKGLIFYIQRKAPVKISNVSVQEMGSTCTLTAEEMSDWILLNPQILAKAEIIFVSTPDRLSLQDKRFRKDWQILSQTGYLTERLVQHSLSKLDQNPKALLAFMEVCNLVCRLARPMQTTTGGPSCSHFLPARLPRNGERTQKERVLWHKSKNDKEFYFSFHGFLPEAVFLRLLARAYTLSCLCSPESVSQVYRDVGLFWLNQETSFLLEFLEEGAMIKVTVSFEWSLAMRPSDVMATLWSMLDGLCRRDFEYLEYHCGPACPLPGCTAETTGLPRSLERTSLHIHNIFPRCCEENVDTISLSCGNVVLNEKLKEWIPSA